VFAPPVMAGVAYMPLRIPRLVCMEVVARTTKKVAGITAGFEQIIQRLSPFLLRQIQQEARHETLSFPTFEVASPPALA
jgi:hypothetical protein